MSTTPFPGATATPPSVLKLTGHPVRWQLMGELARSDRQVRELVALTGQRQSLTSYHLGQLREAGLVTMRRSSADKRDTYYSLDLTACRDLLADAGTALHPGLRLVPVVIAPPPVVIAPPSAGGPPPAGARRRSSRARVRVLFLCTGNSSRSQLAEAILRELGGARVEVASAGSAPKPIHVNAVRVMHGRGIDMSGHRSKHLNEFVGQRFDHVISLCDKVREVCPEFPGHPAVAHWSMPDPAAEAVSNRQSYPAFVRTADELTTRIQFLLHVIDTTTQERI